jgi:hypothetical protein
MPNEVRPYLVPEPASSAWGSWRLLDGEHSFLLPDRIDNWNSDSDLRLQRLISVPHEEVVAQAGLPKGIPLAVTTSWTSSATGMTELAVRKTTDRSFSMMMEITIPSGRIEGTLTLHTTLTLAVDFPGAQIGVASQAGSILLADEKSVVLQTMPMFPVAIADFAATRFDSESSWRLQTSTSLELPFLGDYLLLLNSRDKELVAAVTRGAKDRRQELLVEQLEEELAALMLELAIEVRDDLTGQDWPVDSVGDVLGRLLPLATSRGLRQASTNGDGLAAFRSDVRGAVRAAGRGRIFT